MPVNLIYKHQQKTYELMNEALNKNGRAAYVFPVGCGKSFPVLKYIEDNPNKKVLYVSPNLEIINQIKKYISTYILNGRKVNKATMPNFRGITYQKIALAEDIADIHPDVIVFDEIHRMGAEKWSHGIDGEVQFRPTESSIVYKQQIGRVLSADKSAEETVVIDVVNNWLRQIDTFNELGHAIETNGEKDAYDLFKFSSNELELVGLLKEIGEGLRYNSRQTYNQIINWLETHDGHMPRTTIRKNGKYYLVNEMTDDERDEVNLYARWRVSADRRALEACIRNTTRRITKRI